MEEQMTNTAHQKDGEEYSAYRELAAEYCDRIFRAQESQVVHNPYSHEKRLLESIERGEPEFTRMIIEEGAEFKEREGRLADDPLRHEKNMGIVNVTIASRAAIRAGVHYEKSFTLSDCCIQKIEKCTDIRSVREFYNAVHIQYAELVRDTKAREAQAASNSRERAAENPHIEHCKNYIFTHLHGKITVQEIAAYIGLTPNYLSALFRKYENVSLKQYILDEKIKLVQKMLIYSPYSFIEIANYLGFTSQSHMGKEFKRVTGMTLKKYRETYKKDEFYEN